VLLVHSAFSPVSALHGSSSRDRKQVLSGSALDQLARYDTRRLKTLKIYPAFPVKSPC
jgi:hypothetical protein